MIIAVLGRTKLYFPIPVRLAPTDAQRVEAGMKQVKSPQERLADQFAAIIAKWAERGIS